METPDVPSQPETPVIEEPTIEEPVEIPVDMNAIQQIKVDDELTLVITSGLGERKVDSYPDILMLSDRTGRVVIDVCVNNEGKVISASLNDSRTTIFRSSLSSLAIRKAKEFVFMPSLSDNQCGAIIYNINTDG